MSPILTPGSVANYKKDEKLCWIDLNSFCDLLIVVIGSLVEVGYVNYVNAKQVDLTFHDGTSVKLHLPFPKDKC